MKKGKIEGKKPVKEKTKTQKGGNRRGVRPKETVRAENHLALS